MDATAVAAAVDRALAMMRADASDDVQLPKYTTDLTALLETQPEFANPQPMIRNFTGSASGFGAHFVSSMLLSNAGTRGSATAAVAWLQKVLATERAPGVLVQPIWGIRLDNEIDLGEGVRLTQFEALPESRQKAALSAGVDPHFLLPQFAHDPPHAALRYRAEVSPFFARGEAKPDSDTKARQAAFTRLEAARLCLEVVEEGIVVAGPTWYQFDDADLEAAIIGWSTTWSIQEIVPRDVASNPLRDAAQAAALVGGFLHLQPQVRGRVRTAMLRLHQAKVRTSPGDQSLELAIAFETLLIDATQGEHTFKVALRAGLLTGDDLATRGANRHIVEAAYGMRSALVHSGESPATTKVRGRGQVSSNEIVALATRIGTTIVRRIILDGGFPDWAALELAL